MAEGCWKDRGVGVSSNGLFRLALRANPPSPTREEEKAGALTYSSSSLSSSFDFSAESLAKTALA
ncbi:hypothetical protein, partial [Mesorhizobium sp.]|uniref:hypothetical protein n=1 Tax=Mesorhizobium sp. TaxID=1871066 RepID=UPI00258024E5